MAGEQQGRQKIKGQKVTNISFSLLSDSPRAIASSSSLNDLPARSVDSKALPLVVLLITPAHIKILRQGNSFIPDLLHRTHRNIAREQAIDVLLAVVDKIPYPVFAEESDQDVEDHEQLVGYTGNGVSVMLLDQKISAPELWREEQSTSEKVISGIQKRSTLSFQFETKRETSEAPLSSNEPSTYSSIVVKLPVSNTVFTNSRYSTIQAQRWAVSDAEQEMTLACVKKSYLYDQVIKIPIPHMLQPQIDSKFDLGTTGHYSHGLDKSYVHLNAPLQSITQPRTVAESMGNVVRNLFIDGSEGNVMPASKELESAIERWNSEKLAEKQTVQVWAMVSPSRKRPPDESLVSEGSWPMALLDAKARLHRVLSGGGGWGNRQGLLALDPESDFDDAPDISGFNDFAEEEDPETERRRNLGQIVSPGDEIEFFICRAVPFHEPTTRNSNSDSYVVPINGSYAFGTTASTADEMPVQDTLTAETSENSSCIYLTGFFGMLSESGLSLKTELENGRSLQTKVDAPLTRLSFQPDARLPKERRHRFPRRGE